MSTPTFQNTEGQNVTAQDTLKTSPDDLLKQVIEDADGTTEQKLTEEKLAAQKLAVESGGGGQASGNSDLPITPVKIAESTPAKEPEKVPSFNEFMLKAMGGKLPDEVKTPDLPAETIVAQPQITEYENTIKALTEELTNFKNTHTYLDEYMKNPVEFKAKYEPKIFQQQFDKAAYVKAELDKEFGETFNPDPMEALRFGTRSYEFVHKQDALLLKADEFINTAGASISEEEQASKAQTQQFIEKLVTEKYHLDMPTFQNGVGKVLDSLTGEQVIEMLIEHVFLKTQYENLYKGVTQPTDVKKIPSVTDSPGAAAPGSDKDSHLAVAAGLSKRRNVFDMNFHS